MARTLNKVQLIGHLGGDPEVRFTSAGAQVTTFSLATNRQWQGKDGTLQEETDWHTIVAWEKLAQICGEHLTKGRLVYVEGRLQNRSWESEGQKKYKTEVVASDMLILDSRTLAPEEVAPQHEDRPVKQNGRAQTQAASPARSRTMIREQVEEDPEELPF